MKSSSLKLALVFALSCGARGAFALEIMSSATQLGAGRLHAEVYYRHLARQDLTITLGGTSLVSVKGSTISSSSSGTDLDLQGSGDGVMSRVTYQPFDEGLQFYVVGGMSSYDLSIPSGTYSNHYATDDPGFTAGGGIRYNLVPYTIVSPALSVDLSAMHSRYRLTKFTAGNGSLSGDTSFLLTNLELQGALILSKKYLLDLRDQKASVDPYLGLKVMQVRTGLDDLSTGAHFSGTRTGVAPYVGIKFKPFPFEGIVVEGSFLNELSASVGLTLGF